MLVALCYQADRKPGGRCFMLLVPRPAFWVGIMFSSRYRPRIQISDAIHGKEDEARDRIASLQGTRQRLPLMSLNSQSYILNFTGTFFENATLSIEWGSGMWGIRACWKWFAGPQFG